MDSIAALRVWIFRSSLSRIFAFALMLIAGALHWSASAQSLAGLAALNGTVRDSSGAVVPGAAVTVSNSNIGIDRKMTANSEGYFFAPSLPPGVGYKVVVVAPGFAAYENSGIQLQVGQNITVPVALNVAEQAQRVLVTAEVPLVESTKTGVAEMVSNEQITNLPINGRRVDQFALLTPGVVTDGASGGISFRGVPGGNAFLQDGNDVTQQWGIDIAGGSAAPSNISQDAVQEFQVQTSGYSAEFGRATGGVINTVTKSGTNTFHGSGFWFFRNRTLNAQDRYAPYNPPEYRHQTGGSVGGPIVKDKLFFFANGEFTRRSFPLVSTIVNPLFYRGSTYIGQCGAPATPAQCQAAQGYFDRFFTTVDRRISQDLGLAKLDWRPTDKHSLTASFNLLQFSSPNGAVTSVTSTGGAGVGNNGNNYSRTRTARLSHTYVASGTVVNEARFGWFKDVRSQSISDELAPPNGLRSQLIVAGQGSLGVSVNMPNTQPSEDRFQFADNVSITRGTHQLKFGVDFAHLRDIENALFNGPGQFTYGTITAFAQDLVNVDGGKRWQQYVQALGPMITDVYVRDFNFFAQDQWRVTKGLTVNYGLRYEYNQYTQPPEFNPDYPDTGRINQPGKNFSPRVGIAYAFNKNRTVIRTGYGLFYARHPSATIVRLQQRNGITQKTLTLQGNIPSDVAGGPLFPNRLPNNTSTYTPPAGSVTVTFADPNLQTPYSQQFDFAVEHQISKDMGITVSYMRNRGFKYLSRRDLNIGPTSGTFTYRINDAAGNQVGTYTTPTYIQANRVDPRYSRIQYVENGGRLWYDGLSVSFRRRASNWADATVAYTWSHSIDNNQGAGASNIYFTDPPRTLFNGDYRTEKGSSALDQRHRAVISGIITPPRQNFGSTLANQSLNGWQLSLIVTAATPQFSDSSMLVSGLQYPGQAFNTTLNGYGGSQRVPFLPRNNIEIDSIFRTDGRLTKKFTIKERAALALNFEVFNLFNRISDTSVNNTAYRAVAGVISPVDGIGLGTASGGFPDGTNARRAQVSVRFTF